MRTHLAGIAALIYGEGVHVYDTTANRPTYNPADWSAPWTSEQQSEWVLPPKYTMLTARTLARSHAALGRAPKPDIGDFFRLTMVGTDSREVRALCERLQGVLDQGQPEVEGYSALIRLRTPGEVAPDLSAPVDRAGGNYPLLAVDTYRYDATPA